MAPEFDGLAPIGLKVVLTIEALDDEAHLAMHNSADGMTGDLVQLVDAYMAEQITGTWVVATKVSRLVR